MKKFGSYILLFIIIANFFAPISLNQEKKTINKNVVLAEEIAKTCNNDSDICIALTGTKMGSGTDKDTGKNLSYLGFNLSLWRKNNLDGFFAAVVLIKDDSGNIINKLNTGLGTTLAINEKGLKPTSEKTNTTYIGDKEWLVQDLSYLVKNLTESKKYTIEISAAKIPMSSDNSKFLVLDYDDPSFKNFPFDFSVYGGKGLSKGSSSFTTPELGKTGVDASSVSINSTGSIQNTMPACSILPKWAGGGEGTFMGCVAQMFYYVLFVPTSFLFALGGKFFDFAFYYSVQDSSYRVAFVTEGWKIVRDLCNIFFIFLLLASAIKMILDIGHGEKGTIVKVIVIGLLINFSLFTTQIVIDSSNILARLFYNSDSINIIVKNGQNSDGNGSVSSYVYGQNGQLPLSAALVDKVDPQSIIIEAKKINIETNDNLANPNAQDANQGNQGIGVGAFILIVFITTIINILGFFVFLSVALVFVGRVVGLWFSMIFVPLAFFSYAAPNLPGGLKRFGWSGWWSELLGTAFIAPVFMFMLYLIILFLSKGFMGLFDNDAQGAEFILQTIIPFVVIMILLWQAKSVADEMSKGVASSVTTGLKVAGGAAVMLGGAGVGMAGRNLVGKVAARASAGTTATQEYAAAETAARAGDPTLMNKYNQRGLISKNLGKLGNKIKLQKVLGEKQVQVFNRPGVGMTAVVGKVTNGIGGRINKAQKKVGDVIHASHEYEKIAKDLHLDPSIKYSELGALDRAAVDKKFRDSKRSDTENNIKKGLVDTVPGEDDYIKDTHNLARATTEYRSDREAEITQDFLLKNNATSVAGLNAAQTAALNAKINAPLTESDKNKIKNKLTTEYKETVLKQATEHKLDHDLDHMTQGLGEKISFKDRITADSTRGTYNPLNLSKLESIKNDAFATKLIFGITSAVALGMRSGLKNVPNVNMGTGSREFKNDLKNVFSEAMKGASFKLEAPGGGGGHGGHDDHGHGGGHDDHGHGGGHH